MTADAHTADELHWPQTLAFLRLLGTVVLLLALVGGGTYGVNTLLDPHTLPINTVRVEGEFRKVSEAELYAAIGELAAGGFFSVDVRGIRRAVEQLPWVAAASVHRRWPDTLEVTVTEQQALARWGSAALVNAQGEVFAPAPESFPPGLALLRGPQESAPAVTAAYQEMGAALAALDLQIAQLQLDERRAWFLTLSNGVELALGRGDVQARLARFVRVYPPLLAPRALEIARVDMRYTNGFAVAFKNNEVRIGGKR